MLNILETAATPRNGHSNGLKNMCTSPKAAPFNIGDLGKVTSPKLELKKRQFSFTVLNIICYIFQILKVLLFEEMKLYNKIIIHLSISLTTPVGNMPPNVENSAMATGLEKVSFHSSPKERQCQRMLELPHNCTHLTR